MDTLLSIVNVFKQKPVVVQFLPFSVSENTSNELNVSICMCGHYSY